MVHSRSSPGPRHHPRVTSPHSDILTSFPRDCPWPPALPCLPGSPHLLDHIGGFVTAPQLLAVVSIRAKSAVVPCRQQNSNYQETLTLASSVQGLLGVVLDLGDRLGSHIVSDVYSIHGPTFCPRGHVLCWALVYQMSYLGHAGPVGGFLHILGAPDPRTTLKSAIRPENIAGLANCSGLPLCLSVSSSKP